jgi:hypothetical protein
LFPFHNSLETRENQSERRGAHFTSGTTPLPPVLSCDHDELTMAGRERTVEFNWASCVCGPPRRPTSGEQIRAIHPSPSTATGRRGTSVRSLSVLKKTGWMTHRIGSWPVISLDCRPGPITEAKWLAHFRDWISAQQNTRARPYNKQCTGRYTEAGATGRSHDEGFFFFYFGFLIIFQK